MSLLLTLEDLLKLGVYPRDRWFDGDDDDDDDDDSGGGGGGNDPGNDNGGGGGFDWGDNGDNGDNGDQGGDNGGGDNGWSAVQDYEENGRTIRKFTDNTGTDYFQDVGEWSPQSSRDNNTDGNGFNWGDTNQRDDWMRGDQGARDMPNVDPDIRDLHDYYHPYTISKFEDDPVRKSWDDGIAPDGTRFDQQDQATQDMFGRAYGDTAARSWAEQRSRDLEAEFRSRGVVTLPQQQQQPQSLFAGPAGAPSVDTGNVGLSPDGTMAVAPDGSTAPVDVNRQAPTDIQPIPPYTPPGVAEAPPPTPEPEAPAAPVYDHRTLTPPPGQTAAADAAARQVAAAGGSAQQVADAAAAAALAYDRRNLSSESPETQRQFGQAYGDQANERWVQQHNQELALNRALYGTEEPRAGSPQTGQIPGLGNVGPAPDRTIGRAQPAPGAVGAPTTAAPGAVGVSQAAPPSPAQPNYPPIISGPREAAAAPPTTGALRPQPNYPDIIAGPREAAADLSPGPSIDDSIRSAANIPNPNTGAVRGPTTVPTPLTGPQAAAYERGGVNPATGDIDVQATPEAPLPGASPIPSDAPPPTMREAGFEPASATIPIDASIRNAAGLPAAPDEQIEITEPIGNRHLLVPASRIGDFVGPGLAWHRVDSSPAMPSAPPPAPPPPAPAGPAIDNSIRTAAGVPVDPDLGPHEANRSLDIPGDSFALLTGLVARDQGATDVEGFARNVAAGISKGEAWAEPYVADLARIAWYRESRGLEGDTDKAPDSYVIDWMGAFKAGDTNVNGVREASQALVSRGVAPPSVQASTAPSAPPVQANLTKWTPQGSTVVGANLVPDQYHDRAYTSLQGWDPDATCGVTAGVGMARSLGIEVSPLEAFALARRAGYTSAGGMNGTDNMVKYLNSLGVPNLGVQRADQSRIDAELAAGRPVVIDTAGSAGIPSGHYFTIASKTADGGYVVSGSGTALRAGQALPSGGTVMTRGQMEQATGSWRNAVYLDPGKVPQGQQASPRPTMVSAPATARMQSDEGAAHDLVAPEAQPAEERLWTPSPERASKMEQFEEIPMKERERIFENAMDQGLAAEGITGPDADYWKNNMRTVVTGAHGENADLNPYMMAGESGGRRKTGAQSNSTALGYFQFLRQNPDGSHYSHIQYVPDEYKNKPYDPVGQVRQFVRAIKASDKYHGDPGGVVRDKNTGNHTWGP